jgi:uncharacterized membrane protein YeiH
MHITGKEFEELKQKKEPATALGLAFVVLVIAYLIYHQAQPYSFLTFSDKSGLIWELTVLGFMLKVGQDVRAQVAGMYWAKALISTALAAFGGGFLAPIMTGHCPIPLREETFAWIMVFSWYVTHHIPVLSVTWCRIAQSGPGWVVLTVCFAIFKTQQIVGGIELTTSAIDHEELEPHSRHFWHPAAGPIVCGFLSGCGGAFMPFDKALKPLEAGKNWSVQSSLIATLVYFGATRWFHIAALDAKLAICLMRIFGDLFPKPRSWIMTHLTGIFYISTNVRPAPVDSKV